MLFRSRTDKPDPQTNEEATAVWRISLKDSDERKVGRSVTNAITEIGLATIPGLYGVGGSRSPGGAYGVYRPATVPAEAVPQYVVVLGGEETVIDSVAPEGQARVTGASGPQVPVPSGPTVAVPIGSIIGARSGDKGGHANLGIFARSDEAWAWLDDYVTIERLRTMLPETASLTVERHRFPEIRSLNFVVRDLLEEGVAASSRQDAQAKSLGEWFRSRIVEMPAALLAPTSV